MTVTDLDDPNADFDRYFFKYLSKAYEDFLNGEDDVQGDMMGQIQSLFGKYVLPCVRSDLRSHHCS